MYMYFLGKDFALNRMVYVKVMYNGINTEH